MHFADLDLAGSAGAAVLYQRLQVAAEMVCAPLDDREVLRHMHFEACVQRTISTAVVAKVDQPALTIYCEEKTNGQCG